MGRADGRLQWGAAESAFRHGTHLRAMGGVDRSVVINPRLPLRLCRDRAAPGTGSDCYAMDSNALDTNPIQRIPILSIGMNTIAMDTDTFIVQAAQAVENAFTHQDLVLRRASAPATLRHERF